MDMSDTSRPPGRRPRPGSRAARRAWLALATLLAFVAAAAARDRPGPRERAAVPDASSRRAASDALQRRIYAARDRVLPALVHVEPILEVYARGQKAKAALTGSGVIVDTDGHVLTNDHVVAHATRVTCILADKRELTARVVGRDAATDVAVLKLDLPEGLVVPHAQLGRSSHLEAGQHVLAMGSPLGLARSISSGVVSTPDRYFPEDALPTGDSTGLYNTWIQTDAAINPGNSGGPLVDLDGRVVGINARAIPIFGENIGFAIPIDVVAQVAAQLIARGEVTRSFIGARLQNTKGLAGWFGTTERGGVLVGGIVTGGPADRAGMMAGDVIVAWAGQPVSARFEEELPAARKLIADTPVGTPVPVTLVRDGREIALTVTTERAPDQGDGSETELAPWGFTARDITPEIARRRRIRSVAGSFVTGVKGAAPAAVGGLSEGDVIRAVDGTDIANTDSLRAALAERVEAGASRVLIEFDRGATSRLALLALGKP